MSATHVVGSGALPHLIFQEVDSRVGPRETTVVEWDDDLNVQNWWQNARRLNEDRESVWVGQGDGINFPLGGPPAQDLYDAHPFQKDFSGRAGRFRWSVNNNFNRKIASCDSYPFTTARLQHVMFLFPLFVPRMRILGLSATNCHSCSCRRDALNFSHHRTTPKGVFDMVSLVMPSCLTLTESLHHYRFID